MTKSRKTTIYDIATLTGASPSTVSAALNGTWRERRIREATAVVIQEAARAEGYLANRQARALRQSRSGLLGLMLPLYGDPFFAALAQSFETATRARGLCPVTVSTGRDPKAERLTAGTLVSYGVDALFVAGSADPDALSALCAEARVAQVNLDLPGSRAPSVVSDNRGGAAVLTEALIAAWRGDPALLAGRAVFLGGQRGDHATTQRIEGFRAAARRLGPLGAGAVVTPGYAPHQVAAAARELFAAPEPPRLLFVNSTTAIEGVVGVLGGLPDAAFEALVVGCSDFNAFARHLRFPVLMLRQDTDAMVEAAFRLVADPAPALVVVPPALIRP